MAITHVNTTVAAFGTAASTASIGLHSSKAGGNGYVLGIALGSTVETVSTIVDNDGVNVWKFAGRVGSSKAVGAELWYVSNLSSVSTRALITLSGNSSGTIGVGQFTEISTGTPLLAVGSSADTANSTIHSASQISVSEANALVIAFGRTNVSTIVPTASDQLGSTWLSTGQAPRMVGFYALTVGASTWTAPWRTGAAAATSTGVCLAGTIIAAFSDTFTGGGGPTFLWTPNMMLMGTM